jgi:hypothetical protein
MTNLIERLIRHFVYPEKIKISEPSVKVIVLLSVTFILNPILMESKGLNAINNLSQLCFFRGEIKRADYKLKDTLEIFYFSNAVDGVDDFQFKELQVVPNKNGKFYYSISLNCMNRMQIYDRTSRGVLPIGSYIVEPGDDITFSINRDNKGPRLREIKGKGSGKYQCLQELHAVSLPQNYEQRQSDALKILDSVLSNKIGIVKEYRQRNKLSNNVSETIRCDEIGEIAGELTAWQYGRFLFNHKLDRARSDEILSFNNFYAEIQRKFPVKRKFAGYSKIYVEFLYTCAQLKFVFEHPRSETLDTAFFSTICENYSGEIRDRFILNFISRSQREMQPVNVEVMKMFAKAVTLVQEPNVCTAIRRFMVNPRDISAFNFRLLRDSSNDMVSLSQLRGKVILLDMFSYPCTACFEFANAFHKKVYPQFRNDSNFMVVSIMFSQNNDRTIYFRCLREGEGSDSSDHKFRYTFKEYLNLFAGGADSKAIQAFYRRESAPLIVLVSKDLKIVSSTETGLPFFTTLNSPKVNELIGLIESELKK